MEQATTITAAHRHGNLFLTVAGDLGPGAAHALHAEIKTRCTGAGNIFINLEKVGQVAAAGRDMLRSLLAEPTTGRIYFIGSQGFALSPDGSRVIVRKQKKARCAGCRKCTCGSQSQAKGPALPLASPFFAPA
jgi:hypothetical protein